MSPPRPRIDLKGHCSVINDETLYVYSPDALQALPLRDGGKWKELPMGVSVTGGACVQAVPKADPSQAALWIVGGTTNTSVTDYPGLQKFTFRDQKWETVSPAVPVTQDRHNHGATYLNQSESILVYAGSQSPNDKGPSSQTFLLKTRPPYNVQAFNSIAPPLINPILMPWDDSHAVMIGGGSQNKQVFTFSPIEGWRNLGTTLTQGLQDQSKQQCTLVRGDDGSKVLETYDMGVSPNQVTSVALANANGTPAAPGQTVGPPPAKRRKRDLSVNTWPAYNSTLAPKSTRNGFSVAQDANGLAVVVGGNQDDPLCIFDQRKNAWLNATEFLDSQAPLVTTSGATPSVTPSFSTPVTSVRSSSSPSSTAVGTVPASSGQPKSRVLTVLGATLGAIFGIAAILIIILLLLRWKRERRKRAEGGNYVNEKEDRLSFADRGTEFMHEAGGSVGRRYSVSLHQSQGSIASLAIVQGRIGPGHKRGGGPLGSDTSTTMLVSKKKSPLGIYDPVEMRRMSEKEPVATTSRQLTPRMEPSPPRAVYDPSPLTIPNQPQAPKRSRSSGWSRYFANNEATNLAAMPPGRSTYGSERSGSSSAASQSQYTDSRVLSGSSAPMPRPLDLNPGRRFDSQTLSRVVTGSPTLGHSAEDLHNTGVAVSDGMAAELSREGSVSSISSLSHQNDFRVSSSNGGGAAHDGTASWTPVAHQGWQDRPASSTYTDSLHGSQMPAAAAPASLHYANATILHYPKSGAVSLNPGRPVTPRRPSANEDARDSTVTVFPSGLPSPSVPVAGNSSKSLQKKEAGQQDMSWLDLGNGAK